MHPSPLRYCPRSAHSQSEVICLVGITSPCRSAGLLSDHETTSSSSEVLVSSQKVWSVNIVGSAVGFTPPEVNRVKINGVGVDDAYLRVNHVLELQA